MMILFYTIYPLKATHWTFKNSKFYQNLYIIFYTKLQWLKVTSKCLTPYSIARSVWSSMSTFAMATRPFCFATAFSNLGPRTLQGTHHLKHTTELTLKCSFLKAGISNCWPTASPYGLHPCQKYNVIWLWNYFFWNVASCWSPVTRKEELLTLMFNNISPAANTVAERISTLSSDIYKWLTHKLMLSLCTLALDESTENPNCWLQGFSKVCKTNQSKRKLFCCVQKKKKKNLKCDW